MKPRFSATRKGADEKLITPVAANCIILRSGYFVSPANRSCRVYVTRLKGAGADAALTEYAGAYHAYDAFMLKEPIRNPQAQTTRNCWLEEGPAGAALNAKTGRPYSVATDSCVEKGRLIIVTHNPLRHFLPAASWMRAGRPPMVIFGMQS